MQRLANRVSKPDCSRCGARERAVCRALSPSALAALNRSATRRSIPAGTTIVHDGDPAEWCAVVLAGVVKLVKATSDGREQIVGLQFPGEFLGSVTDTAARVRTDAMSPVELCTFPRAALDEIMGEEAGVARALLAEASGALNAARDWMLVLGGCTAGERVAAFLLAMEARVAGACGAGRMFELPLSRTEIGTFLGLRLETVSRQMRALREAGIVEVVGSRKLRILDRQRLSELAEQPCS